MQAASPPNPEKRRRKKKNDKDKYKNVPHVHKHRYKCTHICICISIRDERLFPKVFRLRVPNSRVRADGNTCRPPRRQIRENDAGRRRKIKIKIIKMFPMHININTDAHTYVYVYLSAINAYSQKSLDLGFQTVGCEQMSKHTGRLAAKSGKTTPEEERKERRRR